jgi:hypothetical protein
MSTRPANAALEAALAKLPHDFAKRVSRSYSGLREAMSSGQYDTVGIRAGKLCETLLRLLQSLLTGTHLPWSTKKMNMVEECEKLVRLPATAGPDGLRVAMPRALVFMYTLRNTRGMGHAAGDIDASEIDAATCARISDWCVCELIRLHLAISLEEAQALLDAISTRTTPEVWSVGGRKRVLVAGLDYKAQVLLLVHATPESGVLEEDLREWVEHPHASNFRRDVLDPLHRARLIEFDHAAGAVVLSPLGVREVEERVLPRVREI